MQPEPFDGVRKITEEDLLESAPNVRFLLVQRLEAMWAPVHRALDESAGMGGIPVDPRLLEIGLRIVKEQSLLYRLQKPPAAGSTEEEDLNGGVNRAELVAADLDALEAKLRSQSPPSDPGT